MGASTGGTISGVGKYLKEQNSEIEIIMVDPVGSVLKGYLEKGEVDPNDKKPFFVEGVGKGTIPGALDVQYVDSAITCND